MEKKTQKVDCIEVEKPLEDCEKITKMYKNTVLMVFLLKIDNVSRISIIFLTVKTS